MKRYLQHYRGVTVDGVISRAERAILFSPCTRTYISSIVFVNSVTLVPGLYGGAQPSGKVEFTSLARRWVISVLSQILPLVPLSP